MGEKVSLPGVGNTVFRVKRVASEFEIPIPPAILCSFGKSRPKNIAANNSSSKDKAGIY